MPKVEERGEFCYEETTGEEWFPSSRVTPHWTEKSFRRMLEEMWEMPYAEAQVCVLETEKSLEERFREQADKWQRETQHLSSPLQRMTHPSYQAILGMAVERKRDVIRLLLRDMQQSGRDWLLALSYLAQANPLNAKDAGKTDKLIESWIKWGKQQGLL